MNTLLLEKAFNCYLIYLDNLNYGKVSQSYCLLYDAILMISNNIDDKKFAQYFENNLDCPKLHSLNITEDMNRKILWTLNSSPTLLSSFTWNEIPTPSNGVFQFTTNNLYGFNYLYVSIPQDVETILYNELDMQIYNSTVAPSGSNQLFELVGTMNVGNTINNVYKKKNVYNTNNGVLFKVKIY